MSLSGLGPETKRGINRSLSQVETARAVVVAENVKKVVNCSQLAAGLEVRGITRERLVE